MPHQRLWRHIQCFVLVHILHVKDSPSRIALGFAIGVCLAWTPAWGLQMVLAVALAAVLRANKAAAIPGVWLTNPVTNVPMYWFAYKLGHFLLTGSWASDAVMRREVAAVMSQSFSLEMLTWSYWSSLIELGVRLGWSLWVGGMVLGLVCGTAGFFVARIAVIRHRRRRVGYEGLHLAEAVDRVVPTVEVRHRDEHTNAA